MVRFLFLSDVFAGVESGRTVLASYEKRGNGSYIHKFAYLGISESKGGNNTEFNPEDEARFKRLSLSPRVHKYWYNQLMSLKVDVYKAMTKYGTEHLQEDIAGRCKTLERNSVELSNWRATRICYKFSNAS